MSSVSHGFSCLCVEGILGEFWYLISTNQAFIRSPTAQIEQGRFQLSYQASLGLRRLLSRVESGIFFKKKPATNMKPADDHMMFALCM